MTGVIWTGLIVVILILQITVMPLMDGNTMRPDLLLIITISSGLLMGKEKGVGIGFFTGLLQDLSSGSIFGLNTLSKMMLGFFFGMAERKVFKEHILLPLLAVMLATILNHLIIVSFLFVFNYKVDFLAGLSYSLVPFVAYNVCFAIPIHWIVYKISKYQTENE